MGPPIQTGATLYARVWTRVEKTTSRRLREIAAPLPSGASDLAEHAAKLDGEKHDHRLPDDSTDGKRRAGRVATKTSIEERSRICAVLIWRDWVPDGGACSEDQLHCIFHRICCSRLLPTGWHTDRLGDLHHENGRLERTGINESRRATSARLISFDRKRTELTPATVLVIRSLSDYACLSQISWPQPTEARASGARIFSLFHAILAACSMPFGGIKMPCSVTILSIGIS